jgi:hypothetical protein
MEVRMKASLKAFATAFLLILVPLVPSYAQNNDKDRGKSFYTPEEVTQMCGVPVNPAEMKKVLAKQDSMYKEYMRKGKTSKPELFTRPDTLYSVGSFHSVDLHTEQVPLLQGI